jgi:hypothetical protein
MEAPGKVKRACRVPIIADRRDCGKLQRSDGRVCEGETRSEGTAAALNALLAVGSKVVSCDKENVILALGHAVPPHCGAGPRAFSPGLDIRWKCHH